MLDRRRDLRRELVSLQERVDGFLSLAASGPAPKGLGNLGSRTFPSYWTYVGFPSLAMPALEVGGLPVGVQLVGFPDGDRSLLEMALWVDAAVVRRGLTSGR
jgi:Asp-tRNA(Asn)/Glu-tRNA(Gln) amidotransferase A subunit family amidase